MTFAVVPGRGRPATDVADLIRCGGTIYLLGREDPYASASPLMTAVAEHVLDTALMLAGRSGWGRLCPPPQRVGGPGDVAVRAQE